MMLLSFGLLCCSGGCQFLTEAKRVSFALSAQKWQNSVFGFWLLDRPHPTGFFASFCFRKLGCIAKEGLGVVEWLGKALATLFGSCVCFAFESKTHIFSNKRETTAAREKPPPPLNQACLTWSVSTEIPFERAFLDPFLDPVGACLLAAVLAKILGWGLDQIFTVC